MEDLHKSAMGDNKGKDISGRGDIVCTGPEEGRHLVYSDSTQEIAVHRVQQGGSYTR